MPGPRSLLLGVGLLVGCARAPCLLNGCAGAARLSAPSPFEAKRVLLDVPFFPNRGNQCGPSALASVLSFWGDPTAPSRLKEEIYLPHLKGSLPVDLLLAARAHGMSAEMSSGSLPQVKKELDDGHPVVAFVNLGYRFIPVGHYVVITGYDDSEQGVYVHTGAKRNAFMPYRRFLRQWDKTERWTLLVRPPLSAR